MFTAHVFFYYYYEQYKEERKYFSLLFNMITIVAFIQSVFKCLQYIRVIDSFGFLVEMIISVFFDLFPFIVIFLILVTVFSLGIIVMGGEFDDGDYLALPKGIAIFLQMFRNSIGDIAEPTYGIWSIEEGEEDQKTTNHSIAMYIIWLFWIINIFLMMIIIVNFLIAEVSQTYDKVKSSGKTFLYLSKAGVNKVAFDYRKFFGFGENDNFVALVFKSPKDLTNLAGGGDDMFGFTTSVKNEMRRIIRPVKNEILKHLKRMYDTNESNKKTTDW
jgi:hypothetical protein